ncbi:MAG: hypothetical protein K8R89_08900 [Anaerolineae bacterium]|nr:hypothetical protein [Anaerolineae bacterium]
MTKRRESEKAKKREGEKATGHATRATANITTLSFRAERSAAESPFARQCPWLKTTGYETTPRERGWPA